MGIPLPVEATLDERAANAAAARAERVFAQAGRDAGNQFSRVFSTSAQDAEQALKRVGDKASDAYDKARDAAGKLRAEEERLQQVRDSGGRNDQIVAQAERVERARRAEIRAIRDATNAYSEYEEAAENAGRNGGQSFMDGIRGSISGAGQSGQDMANDLASGFAGSSALLRLGAAAGPLGLALAGAGALGVVAGKAIAGGISDGMATIQMQDIFQSRMGLDEASMGRYAGAAGAAFANNFGGSVAENLSAAQVALRSGLIDTNASEAEVQAVIQQLQGLTTVTEAAPAELSRSITTLMRTGLAGSVQEASDIVAAGFQSGLDVSGDWLDTVNEYSTQFRKFGLTAQDVLGLLNQGLEGGARDTDKVADSIKEFSIRAVDGSKSTKEGFEALGFNAEEMGRQFAGGGEAARVALGATLDALQRIEDPQQQALVWQRLFGTQWEDMGDAINNLDLSKARDEFTELKGTSERSTKSAADNFASEWDSAMNTVEQRLSDMKVWLADWVTTLPIVRDLPAWIKGMAGDPVAATGYTNTYQGQQIAPVTPSPGGGIAPPITGAIQGDGTFLGNLLDGSAGVAAPPGLATASGEAAAAPVPGETKPIPLDGESTKPTFDPSQYSLDSIPIGQFVSGISMPGGSGVGPMGTTTLGAPAWNAQQQAYGQYVVDQGRVFDAETSRLSAKASAESARIRVLELEASGTATQQEITAAKMAALTSERQYQSAAMKLSEAQQGTWKKLESTASKFVNGMGDIGAALDNDFGISDGLPGIAENIVKLVASIAMAPMTGMLSAVQTASGYNGGSGLVGILGAQGAFGQPQMPGVQPGVPPVGGMRALAQPGESARDFAHRAMMPYWENQGYTVGDHAADAHGEHQNGALDIMVPSIEAGAAVLQQVLSDPNVYGAIFNNQTFGYGHGATPQDYTAGHTGDPNQDHQNHVHVWYKPGESGNINPTGAPPGLMGTSGVAAASGATPVFVVNMPGGSFIPGGLPSAASAAAGAGGAAAGLWDRVAQAESSGNWQDNNSGGHATSSGAPRGGLQITDGTWNAFGGGDFAPSANLATREQQIEVANRIAFGGYNGTPPQGLGAWEAITNGMVPGVSASTPASAFGVGPTIPAGTGLPAGISPSSAFQPTPPPGGGMGTGIGPGGIPIPRSAPIGGQAFPGAGSGGFQGVGGMPLAALSTAASGLDMLAPGAGQAAQIGIQLANRAAAFAGQAAGIGVSGLFETLLPSGDNPMASIGNSWFGKIAGGFAGARPALPNMAGQQQAPPNPNDANGGQPGGGITQHNNVTVTQDRDAKNLDERGISRELESMGSMPGNHRTG